MSLDFNARNVVDHEKVLKDEDGNWNTLNFAIAHGLMFTSMSGITAENADEFYARVHLVEKMTGALRTGWEKGGTPKEIFLTPAEIKSCIGYTINVGQESRSKFMNGWVKNCMDGWKSDFHRK